MRDSRHGNTLVHICASVKGAESEIAERVLCIENHWKRTSLQLDILRRVWQSLDEEHQAIQKQILNVLIGKLTVAVPKIDSLIGNKLSFIKVVSDTPATAADWCEEMEIRFSQRGSRQNH